jgi:hypothetical protein
MNDEERRERLRILAAVAALVIITVLRLLYLRSLPGGGTFIKYLWFADEILAGRLHNDRLADLSPGYLWFVTLLRWLQIGLWPLRGIQIAMVSVVAFSVGAVARRFAGWPAAIVAAVLVLANRAALVNASDFEPETLLLFFQAVGIAIVLRERPPTPRSAAIAGLLIGLAIITRPVALLVAIVLLGLLVWRFRLAAIIYAVAAAVPVVIILGVNMKLTADAVIMDPGTVFFEGMNPRASGSIGEMPQIVRDLQRSFEGPDALHVAYRVIASQASGRELSRAASNRWWASRATAFIREDFSGAAALTLRKVYYAIHAYDAWDVTSMSVLQRSMTAPIWVPWSILIGLVVGGLFFADRRVFAPLMLLAIAAAAPMMLFFVTARHRNPLLISISILGGIAAVKICSGLRGQRRTRGLVALGTGAMVAALLSIETKRARADEYDVRSGIEMRAYLRASAEARRGGDLPGAILLQARARTVVPDSTLIVPRKMLERAAMAELVGVDDSQRLFRIAISLDDAGSIVEARRLFEAVHGVEPLPTRALPPPAWHLARSFAREHELGQARRWLAAARDLTPLDPDVLALAAVMERDVAADEAMIRLYDPFTATLARNEAAYLLCRNDACRGSLDQELTELNRALPLWKRAEIRIAERARR